MTDTPRELSPEDRSTAQLHALPTSELLVHHVPAAPVAVDPLPPRGLAPLALAAGIAGIIVACFVGWGFPIGIVAVVTAIVAIRRPQERRAVAVWALVLGLLSLVYSAGWLSYATTAGV